MRRPCVPRQLVATQQGFEHTVVHASSNLSNLLTLACACRLYANTTCEMTFGKRHVVIMAMELGSSSSAFAQQQNLSDESWGILTRSSCYGIIHTMPLMPALSCSLITHNDCTRAKHTYARKASLGTASLNWGQTPRAVTVS